MHPIHVSAYSDQIQRFRLLCEKLATTLQKERVQIKPYSDPSLPHFSRLETEQQSRVIATLADYLEICESAHAENFSLSDTPRFCWKALRRWGLVPSSDIFEKLRSLDTVEIYGDDNLQIFRNLKFFELCSYTLEELYSCEWWKLWGRDEEVTRQLFEVSVDLLSGRVPGTMSFAMGSHALWEIFSAERYRFNVFPRYACALRRSGEVKGFLFTTTIGRD